MIDQEIESRMHSRRGRRFGGRTRKLMMSGKKARNLGSQVDNDNMYCNRSAVLNS